MVSFLVILPGIAQSLFILSVNISECALCAPNYTQSVNKRKNEILFRARMPQSCWNLNSEKSHSPNRAESFLTYIPGAACTSSLTLWCLKAHSHCSGALGQCILMWPWDVFKYISNKKVLTFSNYLRKCEKDSSELVSYSPDWHSLPVLTQR